MIHILYQAFFRYRLAAERIQRLLLKHWPLVRVPVELNQKFDFLSNQTKGYKSCFSQLPCLTFSFKRAFNSIFEKPRKNLKETSLLT